MQGFEYLSAEELRPLGVSLEKVTNAAQLPVSWAHLATIGGLHVLRIPEDTEIEADIRFRVTGTAALVFWIGARTKVRFLVEVSGDAKTANCAFHPFLEDESRCEIVCIQAMEPDAGCTILQSANVGAGAHLVSRHFSLGARDSVHGVTSNCTGHDARSDTEWVCYAKGTEHHALEAWNAFEGRQGRGEIVMKGVAEDKGFIQEKGKIYIGLGGTGTDTYLTQEVLMLDPSAKVDATPALEIKTNDVKASHSATVSRVTAEDLFYFASRGIPQHEARKMYVLGFLGSQLQHITNQEVRERVTGLVEEKYERA